MGLTKVGVKGLDDGTDGQIITYDANGNPVAVGPGTDGQVLTSTGAGSPPAFEDAVSEGTQVKSTGESGGTKFLREDGDGTSSWQSIPAGGAALTGSTNNTITTVTGANAIQGEASLTYDGSELQILKSSGAKITLENTGNAGVNITGDADRSGADDYIFTLDGKWNGTSVAAIRFESGADTTNKDDGIISFWTAPAGTKSERLRIESGGNLKINDGDLVIGTSGHGIDFSAQTASSATGATATEELFSHYEEGTWTPVLSSGTCTPAMAYYVRCGNMVWVTASIGNISERTSDTQLTVTTASLPFSTNISYNNLGPCRHRYTSHAGGYSLTAIIYGSGIYFGSNNDAFGDKAYSQLHYDEIDATYSEIAFAGWYRCAA